MATANLAPGALPVEDSNGSDPFVSSTQDTKKQHRYSAFDNQQFSLFSTGSPAQTKRALQAHLQETTRRLQEASQLGNSLVQQRKDLEERLKDVEKQSEDNEIGPELRQKLAELEKEYNEVGRETARAFLPKSRVPSGEAPETTAGASVYSSEAQHSPSKVSAPSRKQRNQQPSRIHDITLATEISTSLLSQVRDLQTVLAEKDDALKAATLERSQLEIEVEGLSQRMRTLDESESRLKDVNWSLESQVRDLEASAKELADREQRLNQSLNLAKTEKSTVERDFEELKQAHAKLSEDHTAKTKHAESELTGLRRNVTMGETERGALQRKVEELAAQNQELARAVAYRMRSDDQGGVNDTSSDNDGEEGNTLTPDHSPPPSPSKATPRHGQLESETLKHSLVHAHRMIQNLKNNIHREKTEKIELKRMLQDARDELETKRDGGINGLGSAGKRRKPNEKDVFKKPARPDRLGAVRSGNQEIIVDDEEWEEHDGQESPSRRSRSLLAPGTAASRRLSPGGHSSAVDTSNEAFETATENSDAFETANERDGTTTETDAFHTGAETLDGDSSDDLTETEGNASATPATRHSRPSPLSIPRNRNSYQSTASTSGEEGEDVNIRTPVQAQHPRYRLKIRGQGGYRRSQNSSDLYTNTPPAKDSPASFASNSSTPAQGQSLFAELGNLSGESEDGSVADGTPSRTNLLSPETSPEAVRRSPLAVSSVECVPEPESRPQMVDSSMMTDPWEPESKGILSNASSAIGAALAGGIGFGLGKSTSGHEDKEQAATSEQVTTGADEAAVEKASLEKTTPKEASPVAAAATVSHAGTTTDFEEPRAPIILGMSSISEQETEPVIVELPAPILPSVSHAGTATDVEKGPVPPVFSISAISEQQTEAESPPAPPVFSISAISEQQTEAEKAESPPAPPVFSVSTISEQQTEPLTPEPPTEPVAAAVVATEREEPRTISALSMSSIFEQQTEPRTPMLDKFPSPPFNVSSISELQTEPVEPPVPTTPKFSEITAQHTEPLSPVYVGPLVPAASEFSGITQQHTEPLSPVPAIQPQRPSTLLAQETKPESPTVPGFPPIALFSPRDQTPAIPVLGEAVLSFSEIIEQDYEPQELSRPSTAHRVAAADEPKQKLGFFSSVLPWGKNTETSEDGTQDETTKAPQIPSEALERSASVEPIAVPAAPRGVAQNENAIASRPGTAVHSPQTTMSDGGTQTMVSSDQIDKLLALRTQQRSSGTLATTGVDKRFSSPPGSPKKPQHISALVDPHKTPRRPGSAGSGRTRGGSPPPLPADHKQVIAAAAAQKASLIAPVPIRPSTPAGTMGPPIMPASAYKTRPRTPVRSPSGNVLASPISKGSATPRPRNSTMRSDAGSSIGRRSSMSSFTSEIDQRFGIAAGGSMGPEGFDPATTDPRMIQAITQTMIGEFLWKYTRKAGSENMSENRHRRFFWVHPYTRTLYWSEQNPVTAGRAQLKAKSVAIQAVQVVSDDNPYPPGLHRKSLVILTPGRSVKFTATTSQRHETWFNALSYLLMRTGNEQDGEAGEAEDDVKEFNPAYASRSSTRQTGRSRASISSYTSRRTSSPHRTQHPTLGSRQPSAAQRATSQGPAQGSMSGRFSSLSGVFRPNSTLRGSFSSRKSQVSAQDTSVYQTSEPRDSAEDLRQVIQQQEEESDRLENVRACCDGKHDVGSLSRSGRHRHSHHANGLTSHSRTNSHNQAEADGANGH
ncbi:uncharacterized protein BDZ99DRAFT_477427 [Mytilinidion resinicola]|uniref:PH domain-containing protein n=1 Tax=Mytilinidion resinicola TaxID=574789 RepID=A0A6A6YJG5_9PEZI|nr:uncharacterized protein BDZ99DRAFT_477427 [Mytilinidion resinicola]KAF2808930.1 hypothetical protein BDZ99DRAFT_477427 [Mytilinidion resinicola]